MTSADRLLRRRRPSPPACEGVFGNKTDVRGKGVTLAGLPSASFREGDGRQAAAAAAVRRQGYGAY